MVIEVAKNKNCNKVWLVTTNDNLTALGFYQKRGFEMVKIHRNKVDEARMIKPEIPLVGMNNIVLKHEIEFKYEL